MGASNVAAALALYAGRVTPQAMLCLIYMANVSLDRDDEPWFSLGHAAIAETAFGRRTVDEAALKAVERAMSQLFKVGAIETTRHSSGERDSQRTAKYRLNLAPMSSPEKRGATEEVTPRKTGMSPPEKRRVTPRKTAGHPPKNGGLRSTRNQEELVEEEVVDVRTDVTATRARAPSPRPLFGRPLGDLTDLVSGPSCPHGIRRGDHPTHPRCAICRRHRKRRIA